LKESLDGKRICIVMMSALGDAVHVLPVICAIKRAAPTARITWLLEPAAARLMTGHPLVDEIMVHGKGVAALASLSSRMRGRRFDILIDLQVALKAGLATMVIPARRKIGFDRARARDLNWVFTDERIAAHPQQHVQDQYLEFLAHLGVPAEPLEWGLGPWPGEEELARQLTGNTARPLVSLAIATSWTEKDWVPERWAQLANALYNSYGLQPVLVGGKSAKEQLIEAEIMRVAAVPVISTLGCSLRALVSLLRSSSLVVSPDTAPLHMSVALNVPVVSLMGYTNPRRVGPYRRFTALMVDAYGNPGESYLPSIEYRPGRMQNITVAQVLEKVALWKKSEADSHPQFSA
jgi:heptosyltransferase I